MEADGLVRVVPRSGTFRAWACATRAPSLCSGGVRCGVLWHEIAGQGVSGAAELSLVLRSGRRGRRFKSSHPDQFRRHV